MFRILKSLNLKEKKSFHLATTMPKNKKQPEGKAKKTSEKNAVPTDINGAVYLGKENEIIMRIHAKPGAKESAITDIGSEAVGVQIGAPPLDGEANKELLRYLAEILKLRKSDLTLDKGSRSKEKKVIISKDVPLNSILETLQAVSKQK